MKHTNNRMQDDREDMNSRNDSGQNGRRGETTDMDRDAQRRQPTDTDSDQRGQVDEEETDDQDY